MRNIFKTFGTILLLLTTFWACDKDEIQAEDFVIGKNRFPPLSAFDTLLTNHWLFQNIINAHANTFDYETSYTISGDTSIAVVATFKSIPENENREFNFVLVKGLDHSFPNGGNNSYYGPLHHWNWMKQFSIE